MVLNRYCDSLAIGKGLIDANFVTEGFEVLNYVVNYDFVRTGFVIIKPNADINVRRI